HGGPRGTTEISLKVATCGVVVRPLRRAWAIGASRAHAQEPPWFFVVLRVESWRRHLIPISSFVWNPSFTTVSITFPLSTAIVGERMAGTSSLPFATDDFAMTMSRRASFTAEATAIDA